MSLFSPVRADASAAPGEALAGQDPAQVAERLAHQAAVLREWEERLTLEQDELRDQREQLALTSRYKSEFLANMSHELRTPLNSLLILSRMLVDDLDGNLTPKQLQFANTILASGHGLLALINDILDLSRIESGTLSIELSEVTLEHLRTHVEQNFSLVAREKGLEFSVELLGSLPRTVFTDGKRLQQVLKNLLSNAFKFTERGRVSLSVAVANYGWTRDHALLNRAESVVAFSVSDTGIGIPEEKQRLILEPFQQASGSTGRRFGGSGLGLSIGREVAKLLRGELRVVSVPGSGSTFTLYLPSRVMLASPAEGPPSFEREQSHPTQPIGVAQATSSGVTASGPDGVVSERRVFLLGGSDPALADALRSACNRRGLDTDSSGSELDLTAIAERNPVGILLDLRHGDFDGWISLDRLKQDISMRHVPVAVLTAAPYRQKALRMGAVHVIQAASVGEVDAAIEELEFHAAGVTRRLLVVDPQARELHSIVDVVAGEGVAVTAVTSAEDALGALRGERFHSCVLSLDPNSSQALAVLAELPALGRGMPIIVHAEHVLLPDEERQLRRHAEALTLRHSQAPERLLHETSICLHRPAEKLSSAQQRQLARAAERAPELAGMRVLLIDDDVRSVFAMTSALERHGILVTYADTARDGLALIENGPALSVVLVDIKLPDLDGHEVMRRVRQGKSQQDVPIIAVTAKALPADREKCMLAGATHYISKPIDTRHLVSALRVIKLR